MSNVSPLLLVLQKLFCLARSIGTSQDQPMRADILETVRTHSLVGVYSFLSQTLDVLPFDQTVHDELDAVVQARVAELEEAISPKQPTAISEKDTSSHKRELSLYYASKGLAAKAREVLDTIGLKSISTDNQFLLRTELVYLAFLTCDLQAIVDEFRLIGEFIGTCCYEHRNNFLVLQSVAYLLFCARKAENQLQSTVLAAFTLEKVSQCFQSTLSTFGADTLMSYEEFCCIAFIFATLYLDYKSLCSLLENSIEAYSAILKCDAVISAVTCIRDCSFGALNDVLLKLDSFCEQNMFLCMFRARITRLFRLRVFSLYLSSYQSAKLCNMSACLSIPQDTLILELEAFILDGSISCRIDMVTECVLARENDGYQQACIEVKSVATKALKKIEGAKKLLQ